MTVYRARLNMTLLDGQAMQPSIVWQQVGGVGTVVPVTITEDLSQFMVTIYGPFTPRFAQDTVYNSCEVFAIDETTGDETSIGEFTLTGGGQAVGQASPNQCALTVFASVEGGGRKSRKNTSGFTETDLAGNEWGAALLAQAAVFGSRWVETRLGTQTGVSWRPGIWSRTDGIFKALTGTFEVASLIGSADSRKPGVGI